MKDRARGGEVNPNVSASGGAIVVAAAGGAALNSWWAFGVGLAVVLGLHVWGGSIRLAPARRPVR